MQSETRYTLLIIAMLLTVGVSSAQNLFDPGNFQSDSFRTDWEIQPKSNSEAFTIIEEGDHSYLSFDSDSECSAKASISISGTKPLQLIVSMRGRGHRGAFYEESGRPAVVFQTLDASGKEVSAPVVIPFTGFIGWAQQYAVLTPAATASELRISIVYQGRGPAQFRYIRVQELDDQTPEWQQETAFVPAGAQYSHPLNHLPKLLPSPSQLARPVGADIAEQNTDHVVTVRPDQENALAAAFKQARTLLNQGESVKLSILSGTYRLDSALTMHKLTEAGREALFVMEGAGEMHIKGSVMKGWEANTWTLVDRRKKIYRHPWPFNWGLISEGYYSPGDIICHRREQIFLNGERVSPFILEKFIYSDTRGRKYNAVGLVIDEGVPDTGAGQRNILKPKYQYNGLRDYQELPPGSFGVYEIGPGEANYQGNPNANAVFLRLPDSIQSLTSLQIEVAVTPALLVVRGKNNFVLRNLRLSQSNAHYNYDNGSEAMASIKDDGQQVMRDVLIENCAFTHTNGKRLSMDWGQNVTINRCQISKNGNYGLRISHMYNLLMKDVDVVGNNLLGRQGNYVVHQCGGIDFYGERCRFLNVKANENFGFGFRGDIWGKDLEFDRCEFNNNTARGGMFHEIEWGPITVKNTEITGNAEVGVRLLSTRNVTFENCNISDNDEAQLELASMPGRVAPRSLFQRDMFFVHHNQGLTIRNTTIGASKSGSLLFAKRGNADAYTQTLLSEYTGIDNKYYSPTSERGFTAVLPGDSNTTTVTLPEWQNWSGTDLESE